MGIIHFHGRRRLRIQIPLGGVLTPSEWSWALGCSWNFRILRRCSWSALWRSWRSPGVFALRVLWESFHKAIGVFVGGPLSPGDVGPEFCFELTSVEELTEVFSSDLMIARACVKAWTRHTRPMSRPATTCTEAQAAFCWHVPGCSELSSCLSQALVVHARLVTRENESRFLRELKQLLVVQY